MLSSLEEEWRRQPASIDVVLPSKRLYVEGDEEGLISSLNHLVQNAVEAIDEQGSVRVTLSSESDQARVDVTDDGPGMDKEYVSQKLFEPMDSTKSDGYGLGAYQVREIARAMNGQLLVDSHVGSGTTFSLLLPAVSGVAAPKVVSEHE